MKRRARLQVKPNLGPKPGPKVHADASSKAKPPTVKPAQSGSSASTHDGKADNFTQLKPSDTPAHHTPSAAQTSSSHPSGDGAVSDKPALQGSKPQTSHGSKSPRRSAGGEHPKVSNNSKGDVFGAASPTRPSPARMLSPRRSVSSDHSVLPKSPGVASAGGGDADAVMEKKGAGKNVNTNDGGSPVKASAVKPVLLRGIRSRFSKVRPNLAEAGRKGPKTLPAAEKKATGSEASVQDHVDGQEHDAELMAEADQQAQAEAPSAASTSQVPESSEGRMEEHHGQSETNLTDPSPSVAKTPSVFETDAGDDENASDAGTISLAGTDGDAGGAQEESANESEAFAVPEERKRTQEEKKTRRVRPTLPSAESLPDRGKMKMSDLIYWNPSRNHMKKKERKTPGTTASSSSTSVERSASSVTLTDVEEASNDSLPVPQLKIGPDGNIILNMDSLVMEENKTDPAEVQMETIEEDDDRFITCNSFRENKQQRRWTQGETERFFVALSQVGTDFSLMSRLFPSRTRRDLKNKFSKEEKRNRHRIDKALRERQTFDRSTFEKAKEDEAAEKRRQEALEEEKKRKKKKILKSEAVREEEEEEAMEDMMDVDEQEERKENSRKRNGKLTQGGTKFPAYKKSKNGQAAAGHAEVVEILVSMSQQGSMKMKEEADDESDTSSVISHASSTEGSIFVPKNARRRLKTPKQPRPSPSSKSVVIDTNQVECTITERDDRRLLSSSTPDQISANHSLVNKVGTTGMTSPPAAVSLMSLQNQTGKPQDSSVFPATNTFVGDGVVSGGEEIMRSQVPQQQLPQHHVAPNFTTPGGQPVDFSAVIEGLQAQTTTPVDVVLVEQHGEGDQQGLVHVYLVPRTETGVQPVPLQPGEGDTGCVADGADGTSGLQKVEMTGIVDSVAEQGSGDVSSTQRLNVPGGENNRVLFQGVESRPVVQNEEAEKTAQSWRDELSAVLREGSKASHVPETICEGNSLTTQEGEVVQDVILTDNVEIVS